MIWKILTAIALIVFGGYLEVKFIHKLEDDDWEDSYWMYLLASFSFMLVFFGVEILLNLKI